MYYNPEYMNPIMQGLNQPSQPQQGIASLAPRAGPNIGGNPNPLLGATPPPQQVGGGMYFPGGNPGFDESAPYGQQFNPNQGIASLAGTNPGI